MEKESELINRMAGITGVVNVMAGPHHGPVAELRSQVAELRRVFDAGEQVELTEELFALLMPSTSDFGRQNIGDKVKRVVGDLSNPKIISLGCSTGIEPKWIAHHLLRSRKVGVRNPVVGIDINPSAIKMAKENEYDCASLRLSSASHRQFDKEAYNIDEASDVLRFTDEIAASVRFECMNLLDREAIESLAVDRKADVVTIMNVLKYLEPSAVQQVLRNAVRILRKGGTLITGDEAMVFAKRKKIRSIVNSHPDFERYGETEFRLVV